MRRRAGGSMASARNASAFLQQKESFVRLGLVKILQPAERVRRRVAMSPRQQRTLLVLSVCAFALALGGCGGDGSAAPSTPGPILSATAPPPPPPPPPRRPPPPPPSRPAA